MAHYYGYQIIHTEKYLQIGKVTDIYHLFITLSYCKQPVTMLKR